MSNLTGAGIGVRYGMESTWGDTTSVTTTQAIEVNSFTLDPTASFYSDNPIVSDRMPRTPRKGNTSIEGDIAVNLRHGAYDDLLEAALLGTWNLNTLKAGKDEKSVAFELDLGDINTYKLYKGNRITGFQLTVPQDGVVTSTFNVVGKEVTEEATELFTPSAIVSKEPLYHGGSTLNEGGSAIAYLTNVSMSVDNQYSPNYALGSNAPHDMTYGVANVTGELTAYVPDLTLFNKFLNENVSSIDITLLDPAGNSIQFVLPKVKYSGANMPIDDDQAVEVTLPFTAYYDSTEQTVMKIVRSA